MQNHGEEHWKAMDILLGYIKGNQKHEFIIKKQRKLRSVSYCDFSYGYCKDTRKSTIGELHTIGGYIMICKSQRQKTMTQP